MIYTLPSCVLKISTVCQEALAPSPAVARPLTRLYLTLQEGRDKTRWQFSALEHTELFWGFFPLFFSLYVLGWDLLKAFPKNISGRPTFEYLCSSILSAGSDVKP